nr:hypothetical protein [Streptomyces tendae]
MQRGHGRRHSGRLVTAGQRGHRVHPGVRLGDQRGQHLPGPGLDEGPRTGRVQRGDGAAERDRGHQVQGQQLGQIVAVAVEPAEDRRVHRHGQRTAPEPADPGGELAPGVGEERVVERVR